MTDMVRANATTTATASTIGVVARRLARLIEHVSMTEAEFARRTRLDPSYVNRVLHAERNSTGHAGPKLKSHTEKHLGLDSRYWESVADLDPKDCLPPGGIAQPQARLATAAASPMLTHDEMQLAMVRLAAKHDEPGDVLKELMLLRPPTDADPLWWLEQYVAITTSHRKPPPRK